MVGEEGGLVLLEVGEEAEDLRPQAVEEHGVAEEVLPVAQHLAPLAAPHLDLPVRTSAHDEAEVGPVHLISCVSHNTAHTHHRTTRPTTRPTTHALLFRWRPRLCRRTCRRAGGPSFVCCSALASQRSVPPPNSTISREPWVAPVLNFVVARKAAGGRRTGIRRSGCLHESHAT